MSVKIDLSSHESIPKVVHMSWKNKDIFDSNYPLILNGIANIEKLNPEYKLELSDDADVDQHLKSKLSKWEYFKIRNKKIVKKVDLWRLLKYIMKVVFT